MSQEVVIFSEIDSTDPRLTPLVYVDKNNLWPLTKDKTQTAITSDRKGQQRQHIYKTTVRTPQSNDKTSKYI